MEMTYMVRVPTTNKTFRPTSSMEYVTKTATSN